MRTRILPLAVAPSAVAWLIAAVGLGQAGVATAQTPFVPYFGKNNIHYDTFEWHTYTTDHFEIYYYPELERHLERIAGYAESAYQRISADLKHDLPLKVPMILFKTHSEFEQQNVAPPEVSSEGVAAFAEPTRDRMLLPIDDPPDLLYGLITHELTHIFQFDIIPQSLVRQNYPLWVGEGQADYERGTWRPLDLMMVRDAAVADIVPKMSELEGYGNTNNPRLVYNLGHAVFEFMEEKWGKDGIRQFMFSLRKSVIGGGGNAYSEAFRMQPDEFDLAFERYLKDRFKPFRDKERPGDYGRNLAPNSERTEFSDVFSIAPSPSGDLIAAVTVNRKDREVDIVLISSKDGSIVRNLTDGFDKDLGFNRIVQVGERFNTVPWLAWSPSGDRIAYFVRTGKERTLIVQNVVTRKIEQRIPMKSVDEPESPCFSPIGNTVAFSALRDGVGDIFTVDLESGRLTNLTDDAFADFAPVYSLDGKYLIYSARVSGNQKLFRLDLDTTQKTQMTFGTHDESAAQFIDDRTLVFSSTATDPAVPLQPEVSKNGNIYNIWTLDVTTGELRQYTDALGSNLSAIVLNQGRTQRIAFVTYYKGEYGLHTLERGEPLHTAATADFGAPGPIIDFQSPLQHTLVRENTRKKRPFEKMFLEGRPPVNVGVTSNGDVFGGSQISFGDVLGDRQFNVFVASIAQYRTLSFSYLNLSRRFQFALQGYSQSQFFYGQLGGVFYDAAYSPFVDRSLALATRSTRGGGAFGIYPIDRYRRIELTGGILQLTEEYSDPTLQEQALAYQRRVYGQPVFRSGTLLPFGASFIQETTIFREFGPLAGSTMRLAYDVAPSLGTRSDGTARTLSRQTIDLDVRHYLRLGETGLLATRFRGFRSIGDFPDFMYFGGNSELRGYDFLQFAGSRTAFANAELRFPLIEAALTPVGVIGGIRGVFFAGIGGAWFERQPSAEAQICDGSRSYQFATSSTETCRPVTGYQTDPLTGAPSLDANQNPILVYGDPELISGFRLKDGRASYGIGFETFAFGFPIHFDWSWRTLFNKDWENVIFKTDGGSSKFRKSRFAVWIGYDF